MRHPWLLGLLVLVSVPNTGCLTKKLANATLDVPDLQVVEVLGCSVVEDRKNNMTVHVGVRLDDGSEWTWSSRRTRRDRGKNPKRKVEAKPRRGWHLPPSDYRCVVVDPTWQDEDRDEAPEYRLRRAAPDGSLGPASYLEDLRDYVVVEVPELRLKVPRDSLEVKVHLIPMYGRIRSHELRMTVNPAVRPLSGAQRWWGPLTFWHVLPFALAGDVACAGVYAAAIVLRIGLELK